MNNDATTGDAFTDLDLNALCDMVFFLLVFMHAFMPYKVRRIVVELRATKKTRKRSVQKLRASSFREKHPVDESDVVSVCFDIINFLWSLNRGILSATLSGIVNSQTVPR